MSSGHPPVPEPLDVPVADSHCHLDIGVEGRDGEPGLPVEDALDRAAAVGVPRIVQIGCDLAGARWAVESANRHVQRLRQRRVAGAHVVASASRRASSSSTIDGSSLRKMTVGACSGVPTSIGMLSHRAAAAA